jgi:DNA-binding NtrC family response regulator
MSKLDFEAADPFWAGRIEDPSMGGRSKEPIPSLEGIALVLAVNPLTADRVRLRDILFQGNWKLHEASDCREALALLRGLSVPVLRCERDQADANWEDLLKAMARLPAPPNLIVFSRLADESLYGSAESGGFDVLVTPFEREEALRITFAAWSRWERDFVASASKQVETADRRRMPAFGT